MSLSAAILIAATVVAAWWATGIVRRFTLHNRIVDIPNSRSSHEAPVPRGGGLSIVAGVTASLLVAWAAGWTGGAGISWLPGALLVALVGWSDDRRGLSARTRFAVHFAAAIVAVAAIESAAARDTLAEAPARDWLWRGFMVVAIVWTTNLYNFMDGIDGLAAGEGASAGAIAGALLLAGGYPQLALPALVVAAACAGFLPWNWAPARIFMGDVGSGFLGFAFGALAVASQRAGALPVAAWMLLFGVFVVDATVTLLRRVSAGEKWTAGHRKHAYQRAVRSGLAHGRVSALAISINLALGALVMASWRDGRLLPVGAAACLLLLGAAYVWVERRHPMRLES